VPINKIWDGEDTSETFKEVEHKFDRLANQMSTKLGPNHQETVGICSTCNNYQFAINDVHQIVLSRCEAFEVILGKQRVSECSSYRAKNQMSLHTMYEIATLIDVEPNSNVGFIKKGR